MINLDEIRKEIAINQDTLLGENDPILMLATMVEKVLEQSVSTLNAQQEANVKALRNAVQQGSVEAKATAGKIIIDAAGYVSDQAHNAIDATMEEWREELRKDLRLAWNKIERARKITMFSAAVSSVCALISILAMLNVA